MDKYKLNYMDVPYGRLPDYSNKPNNTVDTVDIIGAVLKVENGPNHTNIFYKDTFTLNQTILLVLVRTKKTKSSIFESKPKYQIEVGGIYYCNSDTIMTTCSSSLQDDCHQLKSLYKLNHIIGNVSKTDITIRKLTDTDTDTRGYRECTQNLETYIDEELKLAKWDDFIIKYRKFIKLGGKKTKKKRTNKKYKNNISRRYLR